jgi:hypothetical protein
MGRKLTVTLAIALLMLVLAPLARADQITTPDGILVIPDGSRVTGTAFFQSFFPVYGVYFQFPGGTGFERGNYDDGDGGYINFTVPVTNLSFTAILSGGSGVLSAYSTQAGYGYSEACYGTQASPCGTFNVTTSGPITSLFWGTGSGFSGVESMSFTVDAGDPPTSSLILLGFGLIGLLVSSRRKVPVCP